MKPSIAHMRAAGLSDQQIVAVLEETERDQREHWRKQNAGAAGAAYMTGYGLYHCLQILESRGVIRRAHTTRSD